MNKYSMPSSVKSELCEMALKSPDREICGFITNDWAIVPVSNVHEAANQFRMCPKEQIEAMIEFGDSIIGVYHSHPGGSTHPSDSDTVYAPPNLRYWIVTFNLVVEWVIKNGKATRIEDLD